MTIASPKHIPAPSLATAFDQGPVDSLTTIDPPTGEVMARLAAHVVADPLTQPDRFCMEARDASFEVPASVRRPVLAFAARGSTTGILVLQGLQVGPVPATPLDNAGGLASRTVLARQMAIIANIVSEMVAYEAEGHGHLLQDMSPNPRLVMAQQSQGSGEPLEAHTEQAHSLYRPDYVFLGCLRGDPAAKTYTYSARKLIERLNADEVALLRRPMWTTTIDESFRPLVPDPDEVRGPFAILSGPTHDPSMLVDQDLMHGITAASHQLLRKVIDLYETHRDEHVLARGEVLVLDNHRAMHGRSAFRAAFDGSDRFIARGFGVRDRRRLLPVMLSDRRTVAARHS